MQRGSVHKDDGRRVRAAHAPDLWVEPISFPPASHHLPTSCPSALHQIPTIKPPDSHQQRSYLQRPHPAALRRCHVLHEKQLAPGTQHTLHL